MKGGWVDRWIEGCLGRNMGEWMSRGLNEGRIEQTNNEAGDKLVSSRSDGADGLPPLSPASSHLPDGYLSCLWGPEEIEKRGGICESQ